MMTRWGRAIDPEHVLDEYPRPEMVRESYLNLNGVWDYAITESDAFPQKYDGKILVPFSPEAPLSGVNRILQPGEYLHYEKQLTLRKEDHERYLLHFGAVDQICKVYVNGENAGEHTGGYLARRNVVHAPERDLAECVDGKSARLLYQGAEDHAGL